MYEFLLVLIVVLLIALKAREHFSLFGQEVVGFTPQTCRPGEELDAGLCYTKCRNGYSGVGPVCWADSVNIGIGTVIGLEPCPGSWSNDGLICREPIYNDCSWQGLFGECWGRLRGGNLRGRLDNGGVCPGPGGGDDHTDKIDGLCYRKCPKEKPEHIPGMPYLCYAGGPLSYGRGVGGIPSVARLASRYVSKDIIGI